MTTITPLISPNNTSRIQAIPIKRVAFGSSSTEKSDTSETVPQSEPPRTYREKCADGVFECKKSLRYSWQMIKANFKPDKADKPFHKAMTILSGLVDLFWIKITFGATIWVPALIAFGKGFFSGRSTEAEAPPQSMWQNIQAMMHAIKNKLSGSTTAASPASA